MIIQIDISGQIQQLNYNSALGFKRSDGLEGAVYLPWKTKKEIIRKYKGRVVRLIEKLHCILIYYRIKDNLDDVKEIRICKDVNYRRLRDLIPLLFKDRDYLEGIKIKPRVEKKKSNGHRPAIRAFRKRLRADNVITKDMIEAVLFEFKKHQRKCKSGQLTLQTRLCCALKPCGIHTAPPGNSYVKDIYKLLYKICVFEG